MSVRSLVALSLVIAAVPTLQSALLPVRVYTTADGLASNRINRIVRDSRGFLWFCTREGLSRFDGYQFTNFGPAQGLPTPVFDLLETRAGQYWVATGRGLARLNPKPTGPLFDLYRPNKRPTRETFVLAEDAAGTIWCGTRTGLYHLEPFGKQEWMLREFDIGHPWGSPDDSTVDVLLPDFSGALWVGGPSGLYFLCPGNLPKRYTSRDGLPDTHVTSLLRDRRGRLWVGTWRGLCWFAPNQTKFIKVKSGPARNAVVGSLLELSAKQLWVGTDAGLSRYLIGDGQESFESYTAANGLSQNSVSALAEDRAGNLWVGSEGANKISRGGFVTYDERDGLASTFIFSIFENKQGELYALTKVARAAEVSLFDGRRFHSLRPNIPRHITNWGWGGIQLSFEDHLGEWWVATGEGLFRFPRLGAFAQLGHVPPKAVYNRRAGLVPDNVFRVFEDSRGDIWISSYSYTVDGLTRWERSTGTLHPYAERDKVSSLVLADAFAEDRAGDVWIAYPQTLVRYRQGCFEPFKLPGDPVGGFHALYLDHLGRLWGAFGGGVIRIDSPGSAAPHLIVYTTVDGLASNDAHDVTEDRLGRIYVANGHGVDCFYPRTPLCVKHYTTADGLVPGDLGPAFCDGHGALWFGTQKGLSRLEPEPDLTLPPPPVFITGLRIRGVSRPVSALGETALSGLQFGPGQNQVQMEFVGLGFALAKLFVINIAWTAATTNGARPPINVQSTTRVCHRAATGSLSALLPPMDLSTKPATLAFSIQPPFWQSWWLRTLFLMLVSSVVYATYRLRIARLLELERLRMRIAADLHDDIGSSLSQIAILSEVARQGVSEEQLEPLSDIAHLSRESVESIADIVWAIDPKQDRLGDLTRSMRRFTNDLFGANGVYVQFRASSEEQDLEMSAQIRRQVFLIFKEMLHNVLRHSACSEIKIDFSLESGELFLKVRDNGRGFEPGVVTKATGCAVSRQERNSQVAR